MSAITKFSLGTQRLTMVIIFTIIVGGLGQFFIFPRQEHQSFWMKNTYLPLDMIFVDDNLTVVGIVADAQPLTTVVQGVNAPSRYVLEVNAGFAARHGIRVGTPVEFKGATDVGQDLH